MTEIEFVQKKQVQIINRFAFVFCFSALVIGAALYFLQIQFMASIAALVAVGFLLAPLLNKFNLYNFSRYALLINANLAIYAYSNSLGIASQTHLWFFTIAIFPLVIFRFEETKQLLIFIAIPALLLLFSNLTNFHYSLLPQIELDPSATRIISLLMLSLSLLSTILAVLSVALNFQRFNTNEKDKAKALIDSAEMKVTDSEKYLRVVLDSIQQGVWGLNTEGKVTFINQTAIRLLGYDSENEIIGQLMHALVHHTYANGVPHPRTSCPMYDSFLNGKTHYVADDVLWRKNGSSFPIAYYSAPIFRDNECIGSVVSFEDLTDRKELTKKLEIEQQKSIRSAKLASLGEMSAGIAHEINNPLTIISGMVETLPLSLQNPEKLELKILGIKKAVGRIVKIIAGLKKFARTGDQVEFAPFSLEDIVRDVLVLCESSSKKNSVPISFESQSSSYITCNEIEIEQVLINMINNAVDAVKDLDEKWIKLRIFELDNFMILQIKDSGTGIPEDLKVKIFEPFFTTKKIGEGTGLGLSISKGILHEHGASISVLDHCENTCFEIRFNKYGIAK